MKATEPGAVIGIALENFNGENAINAIEAIDAIKANREKAIDAIKANEDKEGKILVFLANGEGNLAGHLRQAQDEIKTLKENLEELKLEFSKLRSEMTKNSGSEGGK